MELPDNPSFSDYFHLLFPENPFDEVASKQITMQQKQSHLNSEEIIYLSTQGLEIGLRMV